MAFANQEVVTGEKYYFEVKINRQPLASLGPTEASKTRRHLSFNYEFR